MKLRVLQENLSKALSTTSRFVSSRNQLPILNNILVKTNKNKIQLLATNLELSISTTVGANIEEEGDIAIPARLLTEIVSNLPKGQLDLSSSKDQLIIKTPNFKSNVLGMETNDFPKVPDNIDVKALTVESKKIIGGLSKVLFSVSQDETRPSLTGILFFFTKSRLNLVSTDGFRLSRYSFEIDGGNDGSKIIIPKNILSELPRLLENEDSVKIELKEDEKQIIMGAGGTVVSSRLIAGNFPDYEGIIPKKSEIFVDVDKEEFLRAVKLSSVFARESANVVVLKILKDSIEIKSQSQQSGEQSVKCDSKIEGLTESEFEISFNFKFIEDFLNASSGENIRMEFTNSNAPGIFSDTEDKNFLHLIMPIKSQS